MKTNGNEPRIIRTKDLTVWQKMYIPEIVKGLQLTVSKMFKPKVTHNYPDVPWNFSPSFRGRPVLVEEDGVERCVA
jgi:NADH-quinone oxidoreductase subunit I